MKKKSHLSLIIFLCLLFHTSSVFSQITAGDINRDGKVDSADIARGVQIALGQPPPATQAEIAAGDMNRDGRITIQDLVFIRNTIARANRPPVANASASPDSGLVGTDIQLDAANSFDLDGDTLTYRWRQLHMNRYSTEYMTENVAILSDSTSATPTFNPEWPGNYRFELAVTDAAGLVENDTIDVLVGRESGRKLDVKGIVFWDGFGQQDHSPEFDITPDDSVKRAAVLSQAMAGATRANAEWVQIVPAVDYLRVNPLPKIAFLLRENDLNEANFAAIVRAAKTKGLKFIYEQGDVSANVDPLRPGEIDSLEILANISPGWWEAWFNEFKNVLLDRADWCEKYGVDMFVIMHYAEWTFRPSVYPQYGDRWREIVTAIRGRYNGPIAIDVFSPDNLNFADALDALQITVDGGGYVAWGAFADSRNPTMEEIRIFTENLFDNHESKFGGKVPVHYVSKVGSSDGQVFSEPPPPLTELDYREQVLYHEAFFQAIEDEPWIEGVISERWSWFDVLDYPGIYADAFLDASPRNKPTEDLIKLWFGIY